MKRLILTILASTGLSTAAAAPGATHGTAEVLEDGAWEIGLYAPLRRGMGSGLELSIHPITALLSPHLVAKKSWGEKGSWTVATQHGLQFPTPMLRTLARPGIGGMLPADAEIPAIIALDTRLIASRDLGESTQLTVSARVMAAAGMGDSNWPTIDAPIAYTRTSVFQDHLATAAGVQLDGDLVSKLGYRLDLDGWFLPLSEGSWAFEARGVLPWRQSESFTAQLSGTAVVGSYPYGTSWHLLPGFDLIWSF
jgi:hypothetical protein